MMLRIALVASIFAVVCLDEFVEAKPGSDFVFRDDDYDDNNYAYNDQPYKNTKQSYKSSYKTKTKSRISSRNRGDIDFEGGCTSMPDGPINGNLTCHSQAGCRVICKTDYRFPNGETELAIVCHQGQWRIQGGDYYEVPHCEPICLPECKNNGICAEPNRCNCPENFSGPQCQFENKPCLNSPPLVKNAKTSYNTKTSTITCYKNFVFPDGSSVANMICKHGSWEPTKSDWVTVPDCQPVCHPPCQNDGICLSLNTCQCPQNFRGPQCQYSAEVCSGEKLGFNGGFSCNTIDEDTYSCTLTCPQGAPFEFPPASAYICRYETGIFLPQPIPQCRPPRGGSIVSLGSFEKTHYITHTMNTSWEFESNGFRTGDANSVGYTKNKGLELGGTVVEGGDEYGIDTLMNGGTGFGKVERVEKKVEAGACFTWGGVHYKTFDGHVFSFGSDCSYTLLKDTRDGLFTVAVQNDPLCPNVTAACPRILRIFVQGKEYDLSSNPITHFPELRSGKKVLPVPSQLPHLRVEAESGQFLAVSLDAVGLKIKWDGEKLVQIEASESLWNRTAGLCGNLNGERSDDYGFGAKSPLHAAAVWKIENIGEKCEEYPSYQNPCGMDSNLARDAEEFCTKLLSDKRYSSCANLVDVAGFHEACKWDYCSCNSVDPKRCACDTMAVYVRQCAHKGLVALTGWRDSSVCPMECNNGRVYMACGPKTQQSCGVDLSSRFAEDDEDFDKCEEGCFCPVGTLLHEGKCIEPSECPCRLRGKSFEPGATVPKDCNTCVCVAGQWTCTESKCSARCSAVGDPHYTTFDGKRYDFMGKCSYYLVKGDGYSVETENTVCSSAISEMMGFSRSYQDGDPSCTKTVTIRVNDVAVKLKQNRQILVNGEDVTTLPLLAGGMRIRIVSSIFIAVELPNGIQVMWDGVSRVYVTAPPEFRGKTKGLCGTFSANQKTDFLTPDGDVEQAVVPFANKWKTNEHCADIKKDSNHPCDVNPHKRDAAEKYCSVLKKKTFLDCHWHVDPEPYYKDCLYDMCACEDKIETCLCPTLAAYSKDCAHSGVVIPWHQEVEVCRQHCPGDQEYQICGSSCTRSCADISFHHECKEECVEGCNCPKGLTLDVNGDCIPISQCPCTYGGLEFLAGYREVRPGTKGQELCTCASGIWNCNPATPDEVSDYPAMTQLKTLCSATKHQEVTTCEPVEPRTCRNMHKHISQSPAICRPGCICKAGFVLDPPSGECVPENQCPCYHGGRSYKEGMVRQKECNTCKCTQSGWDCTDIRCPGVCSIWGDSHYKSFDDKLFDFQGACEYVLAKGKLNDDEGFDVTVRNVPCGTTGVTCSKSVTLTIGKNNNAPEEKITLTRGKKLTAEDTKDLQRIAVRRTDLFVFLDIPDLGLVLQWDEGTRVYVRLDAKWKGRTKGLCGDFNDNAEDDFKTPSGGLAEASASLFGDSWKLSELCAEPSEKAPDTCAQRPERKLWAVQKCRIMKSEVFEPCHSEVLPDDYIERCIYDACGCDEGGDCECLCTAIAAYAQECNAAGVPIQWRNQKMCPMQCDETCSNYSPCVSTCPRETCDNLVTLGDSLHLCDQDTCVEGCQPKVCPEGQVYLNSSYSECVPRADCKPVCTIIDGVTFYEGDRVKGDDCHSCFCSRGKVVCKGVPCAKIEEPVTEATTQPTTPTVLMGDIGNQCQSGWTTWLNRDRPKDNEFRSDIEEMPTPMELLNIGGPAFCRRDKMIDIQCRDANTKMSHKEIGMNVDCSLDTGLVCHPTKMESCPDFEISILCQCEDPTTTALPPTDICQLNEPYHPSLENCYDFFQCGPTTQGTNEWVKKTCGPDMMFHESLQICDWPANVAVSRPQCASANANAHAEATGDGNAYAESHAEATSNGDGSSYAQAESHAVAVGLPGEEKKVGVINPCQVGEHWDDCAIQCSRTCHHYNRVLIANNLCNRTIDCVAGCVPDSRIDCTNGYWRDALTCVDNAHCTCMSDAGNVVPPSQVVKETDCKSCQCINNYYTCDESVCKKEQQTRTMKKKKLKKFEFRDVMFVPKVDSPPRDCPPDNYVWLTEEFPFDVTFSASSYVSAFVGEDAIRLRRSNPMLTWRPSPEDSQPWVEVRLEKPQPIYGIIVGGDAFDDIFVTSYYVIFSEDGRTFSVMGTVEKPEAFRGPAESNKPVKQMFQPAIEAKIVRVYPVTWHNGIAMQVELVGCGEEVTTTPASTTVYTEVVIEPVCDDLMGYDSGLMSDQQVSVTSTYINKQPDLRLSTPEAWHPLLDNPDQYVQFDFIEPRNITGVETKGGEGTWVTRYMVKYSSDGQGWSPVIDDFGAVKEFLANVDDHSSKINYFKLPISAKLLRIYPTKWHEHIGMRVEIHGCFVPYPTVPVTPEPIKEVPKSECNVCPGIDVLNECMCEGSQWWDGRFCVAMQECPCIVNGISYSVGANYETSDCQICTCAMSGLPICQPKTCPTCSNPEQRPVVSELCGCLCKNCPAGQRLCRTNDMCIDASKWCDGVNDCPDDEANCTTVEMNSQSKVTKETTIKVQCATTCPPGFVMEQNAGVPEGVNLGNFSFTMKQSESTQQSTTLKWKVPPPRFDPRFGGDEEEENNVCPKIVCKPIVDTNVETCQKIECPAGFQPTHDPSKSIRKTLVCDNTCIPIPPKKRVCNAIGRSFTTFDGLDYKYDVCNHILARDMGNNKWYIIVEKVCTQKDLLCQKTLLISFDDHTVILQPNMNVTIDGHAYSPSEVKHLGDKNPAMRISRVGNALRMESRKYPFWALLDASGTIKIGVSEELADRVDGMCGFLDGIRVNDQQKPDGTLAKSTQEFGDSWKVLDSAECKLQVCPRESQLEAWKTCTLVRDAAFEACSNVLNREKFVSSCLESSCACLSDGNSTVQKCRCDALSSYVSSCMAADSNVDLSTWRSMYDCPVVCESPFVQKDCFRQKCEVSCENLMQPDPCPRVDGVCVQGCFCPDGMVRHGDTCVPPAECRDCVCDGLGNSRYVTFDRSNLLFNGNCTYMLSRDVIENEDGKHKYEVMVTNGACDEGVCTEVITVLYDNHVVQIRKASAPHQLIAIIDGQQVDAYPYKVTWLVLALTASQDVQLLLPELQLEIVAYKYNLAFVLRLPSHTFGGAMEGLCGNCNGRQNDDLKMNDGELTTDEQQFGRSWAVKNLPETLNLNNEDQCSSKPRKLCVDDPSTRGYCEKLLQDATFARCHGVVDPSPYYLACKDALCEGVSACANFEAYARMCSMGGVCIDWRRPQLCPYECAPNMEYQACGTGCAETCKSIENPVKCTADPIEGCFCPTNFVWQNGTCIDKRKCFACDDMGHVDGDVWQPNKCTQCTCNKRLMNCTHVECPAVETVCDENSDSVMVPGTENDCCPKYLCVPIPTKPPVCVEMQQPECGYAQTLKVTVDENGCRKFICQCVSEDQCSLYNNDIGLSSDLMEPGFVLVTDNSGCCPKTTKMCKPETCPPKPECQKYYKSVAVENPNACCVQYNCEPPKDLCLYYLDATNDLNFADGLVAKQIGDIWEDGKCKTCTCDFQDGLPTPRCVTKDCLKVENHPDINDYVVEGKNLESECCPNFERVACKDNGNVYQVGDKWFPLSNDTCMMTECLMDENGLRKKTFTKVCSEDCEIGYKYHETRDRSQSCCGECKPYACVVEGVLKDVADVWYSSDYCVKMTCAKTNGSLQVQSERETCETINPQEELDYKIEAKTIPGKCCPKIVRTACLADGKYFMPGSSWKNSLDSCLLESCVETPEGQIVKQKEYKTCNTECPKGWEYRKTNPEVCCGECKQEYCIVDDYLYAPGKTWYSSDNCTTYSCAEKSDQLLVTKSSPVCPEIDCDPELIYYDGCCQKCNLTHESKVEQPCVAEVFDFKETVGLISEKKGHHGICKNLEPIEGLTECYGNCNSSTHFDTKTWDQVIDCTCCQPLDYRKIDVNLTCEDGKIITRSLTVPTVCTCKACTGKKHPKHDGLKAMLKKYREEKKIKKFVET